LKDVLKDIETLSAKAQVFSGTAEQTLSIGDYDSRASRCYYAMFLMAQAALLTKELSASTYKGVISLFGEHFARTKVLEKNLRKTLNLAYRARIIGDYGVDRAVSREEAEDLLEAARDFVGKVKEYLDKWAEQK
jgi:uncharacterized protein (UPF0332 family)